MMDGGRATAIVVIAIFVIFIVWAKTTQGRASLRNAFGEPYAAKPKPRKRTTVRSKKPPQRKSPGR